MTDDAAKWKLASELFEHAALLHRNQRNVLLDLTRAQQALLAAYAAGIRPASLWVDAVKVARVRLRELGVILDD